MKSSEITLKNTELAERFKRAIEKLEQEKETMEKIKERNLWQKIFSNNTRDLARAGIGQSEAISELNAVMQKMMELIVGNSENQARIMSELHDEIVRQAGVNSDFMRKIASLALKALEHSVRIKELERKSDNQGMRIFSAEQLNKILLDIKEISLKKGRSSIELLLMICEHISKYLAGFSLTNNNKRAISMVLKDDFTQKISGSDLNSTQKEIASFFATYKMIGEQNVSLLGQFVFKGKKLTAEKEFAVSDIISGIIDAVTVSETERYVQYRDQLIQILDEFVSKGIDVDGEHTPELLAIRKRLKESQFEIALIGEFQGGKSTTFNMLCGGREISPRGLNGGGIKTSAAVVTAQNIDGDETQNGLHEWAEITWLTPLEIKRRIFAVLKKYDNESKPLLSKNIEKTYMGDVGKLLKIAWDKNPKEDDLDLLRIATLQYKLLASPAFDRISSQQIVPVDQFQKLVTFPQNWEDRWQNKINADFKPEECCFSIVDRVLVRIHSAALAKLGCKITDCPGLFVSQWDTDRAIEVMRNANAIWYLLSGEKQIGKNDLRALSKIKDYRWQDKCFFSINRRKGKKSTELIAAEDMAKLKNAGFYPDQIFMYDAFLSFRCAQIEILAKSPLPSKDCECLAIETVRDGDYKESSLEFGKKPEKCSNAIRKLIRRHLMTIDEEDLADDLMNSEKVSSNLQIALLSMSGRTEILNAVEKLIITSRARSILVSEGSKKCLDVLEHFKNNLLDKERAAEQTLQDAQKNAEEAKTKLEKFEKEWKEQFEFLNADSLDDGLAMDFFAENDHEIRETIKEKAIEICKEEWHGSYYDASDVDKAAEERIQSEFIELVKAKIDIYRRDITSKPKFMDSVGKPFLDRLEKMNMRWDELKTENDLLNSLTIISEEDIGDLVFGSFNEKLSGTIDLPWYSWELLKDIFSLGIRRFFQTPDDRIENFFRENDPVGYAYNAFKGDSDNEKKIAFALGAQRRFYISKIKAAFENLNERLVQSIQAREDIVKSNNSERERIAKDAKDKRENIVEPYAQRIQIFQDEVFYFYAE